ncbi:hypothetical protein IMG5_107660 [Ichthyophthirius multifiliis]|uniref:Uncharacterized protein n=1 Tax=Ichthyophthirius multifiliis TaxID=5932 RepID=G0QTB1_ICHMU|nr:hypothetical protein IMG5_107660 [Ichthyophthirius multifiliis]EGR31546.1 hypothetical protein IMG5_107660 [Ichthyophthirius multifiliis]|eukprot:XP_004035032.1 hypothetical protein IMG5_107660 [Ichthyophthirius multifiliis]
MEIQYSILKYFKDIGKIMNKFIYQFINQKRNIVLSCGKDGCIYISNIQLMQKLVQFKDFISTSPMSQYNSIFIDLEETHILSSCGDGSLQVWQITNQIKTMMMDQDQTVLFIYLNFLLNYVKQKNKISCIKIEKSLYNIQILAQEDIEHTVQVIQCLFYGKFILYLTSQGYINMGIFIKTANNKHKMRKFDVDVQRKNLNFFPILDIDIGEKISNYNQILYIDQQKGLLFIGKRSNYIFCYDIKEIQEYDLRYNFYKEIEKIKITSQENIKKIFLSNDLKILFALTDNFIEIYCQQQ